MDSEWKVKYEKYKKTVKIWEYEFKKQNHRIPSKVRFLNNIDDIQKNNFINLQLDIKDAPYNVKQAYKMYYRMKTSYLTDTLTDILNDDDNQEEHNSTEFLEISYNNASFMESMNDSISDSIHELLDPKKKLPDYTNVVMRTTSRDFEAVSHDVNNEDVWNKSLNKRAAIKKEEKPKKADPLKKSRESFSLKMDSATLKAPRNPRKALSKTFSSQNLESESSQKLDTLPDLETILLEKSRTAKPVEVKKVEPKPTELDITTSIDNEWLNRNAPSKSSDSGNLTANFSTSSFGLSNLNLKSFDSTISLTKTDSNVEAKYHTADLSDSEYIDSHENLKTEILPISKKRRLAVDTRPTENVEKIVENIEDVKEPEVKKIPEKPKRKTVQNKVKITQNVEEEKTVTGKQFETDDDSDKDPTYEQKNNIKDKEDSPEPVVMKRKKSLIKRSKEGINKVTKKAAQLLTRNKTKQDQNDENEQEEEEQINFFVDTEINSMENIPRVSEKELKANEKLFGQFALQHDNTGTKVGENLSLNLKTRTKKDVLKKKIESGTLNDNYVRVNLKKKVFVRGKKAFNFSRYKKTLWKKKKAEDLNDMRGCDGGVLKCFSCGGVGHFAQQCKQKGDSLLPVDAHIEDESPLPTLQQAAEMANDQKLLAHANKPTSIPSTSNEIWKEDEKNSTDEEMDLDDDIELIERELRTEINKENENLNANVMGNIQSYIGHKIPDDFLKKCDYFNTNTDNNDEIKPYYELDADGTVPSKIPNEVYKVLENFGHKDFRKGQEKAIMRVLCGQSTLVTLSTGSGKSLCYQLPAYLYRQKYHCITLVISPLVSLMEDQVHGIPDFINAQCLHTNQTPK